MLNYGYTVLRAAVARAVMLAGLHPAFGLHHRNKRNTMPLVDDLIEPFRPLTDLMVFALAEASEDPIPPIGAYEKERLVSVPSIDLVHEGAATPVTECLLRMTRSLAEVCEKERTDLVLPAGLHGPEEAS